MVALSQAQDWGSDTYMLEALELLGRALAARGQAATAVRLLSAVDNERRSRGWDAPATAAVGRERASTQIGDVLGAEEAERLHAEGEALTLEEAAAYAGRGRGKRRRPSFGWASLTPTEEKVVELVVEGLSNAEIASRLFVSLATVKSHLNHVYAKVGVTSRLQLARDFTTRQS
jgi:DNA-binding CsgD family transcriptional regulator